MSTSRESRFFLGSKSLSAFCPTVLQNFTTAFSLKLGAEPMHLFSSSRVRLECSLNHFFSSILSAVLNYKLSLRCCQPEFNFKLAFPFLICYHFEHGCTTDKNPRQLQFIHTVDYLWICLLISLFFGLVSSLIFFAG